MNNILEYQAIISLLNLCDQEIPCEKSRNNHAQTKVLSQHLRPLKCNSVTTNYKGKVTNKIKTQEEIFTQTSANSTQNKQNLKKILQKLKDSPNSSPLKRQFKKAKYKQLNHMKSQCSQPRRRSRQFIKTPDMIEKSLHKIMSIVKQKGLVKSLIKNKTMQSTRKRSLVKMQCNFKNENYKIATLREMQGLKRSQMVLNHQKRSEKKETISIYNLLKHQQNINTLINGQTSQVNLKHLLF